MVFQKKPLVLAIAYISIVGFNLRELEPNFSKVLYENLESLYQI